MLSLAEIKNAKKLISPYLQRTPVLRSHFLDELLGHEIYFKAECMQTTGAFKIRGVLNSILTMKNNGTLPKNVSAYSSGNHAQALAWAGEKFGFNAEVYMPSFASQIKQQAARKYGAKLITTRTRIEAEKKALQAGKRDDCYFLHPSDNDMVIAGAGTMCLEALEEMDSTPDAIFATCGGGALLSGTYIAAKGINKKIEIYGAEPQCANDACMSVKKGKIVSFTESPDTIADGARTLAISMRTFEYIKKLSGIYEISEEDIIYWTAWLSHLLKISCEPTCAVSMAAAFKWLSDRKKRSKVLVMLSGGNIDQESQKKVWKKNHLEKVPAI